MRRLEGTTRAVRVDGRGGIQLIISECGKVEKSYNEGNAEAQLLQAVDFALVV
jgi:hypothetical protein